MNRLPVFRVLLLLLCATLILPLVGCQTAPDPVETDPVTDPATDPATDPVTDPATEPETEPETEIETQPEDWDTMWTYVHEKNGVLTREITVWTGKGGEPLEIIQITDIHFNYCNAQDLAEQNPAIMSTYEHRKWLANGSSAANARRILSCAQDADMVILTGDTLDYLSYGAMELTRQIFFDALPGRVMASLGNHELSRQCEGLVPDTSSMQSRLDLLQEGWVHDIAYSSVVLGEKVMLIQLDNSLSAFLDSQVEPFKADLALAREKGYAVLLFYHVPIATGNPDDYCVVSPLDGESTHNLFSGPIGSFSKGASKEVYTLITENADIIKGAFCGHLHKDFYGNIKGTGENGKGHLIPQYLMRGSAYEQGHMFRIIVK